MRIGVVGARGFLGSNLVAALDSAGHRAISFTTNRPVTSPAGQEAARGLDGLVWAATTCTPASVGKDPASGQAELATFVESLASLQNHEIPRFVFISSGGTVYGNAPSPHSEDDEPEPTSEYGRLKMAMEHEVRAERPEATILRPSNVYGPGQVAKGGQAVLGHWLQALADSENPTVYGDPNVARDYVYVSDCTRAIIAGLAAPGETINIGSGVPTSLANLLAVVEEVTGRQLSPVFRPGRPYDNRSTWLTIDRAKRVLGWEPTTSLIDGVAAMWDWMVGR